MLRKRFPLSTTKPTYHYSCNIGVSMDQISGDLNLDKALVLADALEDEELVRKLRMNK